MRAFRQGGLKRLFLEYRKKDALNEADAAITPNSHPISGDQKMPKTVSNLNGSCFGPIAESRSHSTKWIQSPQVLQLSQVSLYSITQVSLQLQTVGFLEIFGNGSNDTKLTSYFPLQVY